MVWTLDRQRWSGQRLEGRRIVSVDAGHFSSTDDRQLLVYDRTHP